MQYLIEGGMITKQQHGFLARHSTCTQLLECLHDWSIAINNKKSLDIIYIDYSRAFGSVVHSKLLLKFKKSYGIKYDLFNWISSFLYNRKQRVILNNCSSDFSDVYSGIAQGSVIGPLLYLLYINDLAEIVDSDVKCKLYADDVKLYSCIDFDPAIQNPLANALEKLIAWSDDWQLSVNINKSNVLHIGRKNYNYEYKINNVNISSSKMIRDLGVEIDDCFKFDVHISCLVKKACIIRDWQYFSKGFLLGTQL